jgi:hypothetical protein
MRSISGANLAAQQQPLVNPAIAINARDEVLHFAAFATSSPGTLDTQIAQSFCMRNTGALAYATYMHNTGVIYLRVFDTSNNADYGMPAADTTLSVQTMRSAIVNEGGTIRLYTATMDGAGVQVKRATLTSTTNPVSVSLSNYGLAFGEAFSNNSSRVRRVEAVCPTDYGVVVAVGTHDFTLKLSTIQFYWIPGAASAAIVLNTLIQIPMFDSEAYSAWYSCAKYCSYITAIANTETGAIHVIANDQQNGRAVQFYIKSGIESALVPVAPIAAGASLVGLMPASVTRINSVFYLTARFTRKTRVSPASTIQVAALDLYLQSADAWHWSLYERSSFITKTDCRGALLLRNDSPATLYYAGAGQGFAAAVTQLQVPAASASVTLDDYIESIGIDETAEAADQLTLSLANPSTAGGGMLWDGHAHVRNGAALYLKLGYDGNAEAYGVYGIDDLQRTALAAGETSVDHGALAITARDLGQKKLIDHNLLTETDLRSQLALRTTLSELDALNLKTPAERGYKATKNGLVYDGRNQPFIALVESDESGDALMEATVQMDGGDNYAVSSIGFVFGCDDDGNGNVVVVPRYNTWTAYETCDRPRVRTIKLNSIDPDDPDKEDTGWNFKDKTNTLWAWSPALASGLRTQATPGAYRAAFNYQLIKGYLYDVAVRISGRRVQVFVKPRVTGSTTWAANAQYTLWSEFLFDWQAKRSQAGEDQCGLALSTDVWGDTAAFAASAYDDVEQTLTHAANNAKLADYSVIAVQCNGQSPIGDRLSVNCTATPSMLVVGQYVRLRIPDNSDKILKIASITGNNVTFTSHYDLTAPGANGYIQTLATDNIWGFADCGKRNYVATEADELGDLAIPIDPKARKLGRSIRGRAIFISDDNTASSIRMLDSDGVRFWLWSGYENRTRVGWDETNPIASDDDPLYSGGSEPSVWRVVMHHGYVFDGAPSAHGLPASSYLDVDDECLRYAGFTFYKRGMLAQNTWTVVPAFYAPLAEVAGPTSTLRNWRSNTGAQPGDDLGDIQTNFSINPAGLLAEVVSKSGGEIRDDKQYYVASATKVASPTVGNTSYVTLDKPFENSVRGADPNIVLANGEINPALAKTQREGDLVVLSGRGQWNTKKETHDADAPVLYSPRDASGNVSKVIVSRWARYAGRFQTVEDGLRRLAALAGVRNAVFRNDHSAPTANWSGTITTTPQSLPLRTNLANFTLDALVHIPGNDTNAGGIANERRLNIFFRGYYRLSIQQYATAADYAAGRPGVIRIGLATTSTDIAADANGDRWLKVIPIPDTDVNVAGVVSGSNPNYTLSEITSQLVDLRVAVCGERVVVEINRKPFWTFNLDDMTDGSTSWRRDDAGPIQVSHTGTVPGYTATIRVLELGDELSRHTAQKGSSAAMNIDTIKEGRHIRARSTAAGGMEFARFWIRDDAGSLSENMWRHVDGASDVVQRPHVEVTGAEISGEYIDELLAQAQGAQFASITNETVGDWQTAGADALLQMREAGEFADVDTIDAVPLLHLQPEDSLALSYTPGGDSPSHASSPHVLTTKSVRASVDNEGNRAWEATYQIRGFRP